MGVQHAFLNAFIDGDVEIDAAHGLMRSMAQTYPVALSDLLVETDDTMNGARITTAAEGTPEQQRHVYSEILTLSLTLRSQH